MLLHLDEVPDDMKLNNVWLDLQDNPLSFHDTVCVLSNLIMQQDWQIMLSQEGKVKCSTRHLTTLVSGPVRADE